MRAILKSFITCLLLVPALLKPDLLCAQDSANHHKTERNFDRISIGLGFGQPYGGLGTNVLVYPEKRIGLFAGFGYTLVKPGFNAGVKFRCSSRDPAKNAATFFLVAMYGYNTVLKTSEKHTDELFYGYTFGLGLDTRFRRHKHFGYWSFGVYLPFRKSFKDYTDDRRYSNVSFDDPFPLTISAGYHIVLN